MLEFPPVTPNSDTWPYEQVAAVVRDAWRSGRLKPGEKLPSVARIAQEAEVSKQTVQNALAMLAGEGIVYTRDRLGTFAGPGPSA